MRTRFCACACVALCIVVFGGWSQGFAKETTGSDIEELKKQMAVMEEQGISLDRITNGATRL